MFKTNPYFDANTSEPAQTLWALDAELLWPGIAVAVICINLFAGLLFAHDKQQAIHGGWRVRESTLLGLALIGGSPALLLVRRVARHKTRKQPFASLLIAITGLQMLVLLALLYSGLTSGITS